MEGEGRRKEIEKMNEKRKSKIKEKTASSRSKNQGNKHDRKLPPTLHGKNPPDARVENTENAENEPFSTTERSERVENFLYRATRKYTEAGIEQATVAMQCLGANSPEPCRHAVPKCHA